MSNVTDINDLGTEYIIYAEGKKPIRNIRIIWADELLSSTLGEYNEMFYDGFSDYMEASVAKLTNFVEDPYGVTWYASNEKDFDLHEAVALTIKENNDIVVVEMILDNPPVQLGQ